MKSAIIIGAGLGGLATALRLSSEGYQVTILEKYCSAGGRLNRLVLDGFKFDMGPSFMSMTYEMEELFKSINEKVPFELEKLDPIYQVFFEGQKNPKKVWSDLDKLEKEFASIEPNLKQKAEKYLSRAAEFFNDTEQAVVKTNFDSKMEYLFKLSQVPWKHIPYLFKTIWGEVEKTFQSNEVRIIFSLVAFFLGATPFKTPAIYSLLNYTELKHNGYWRIKGGMYRIVEEIMNILERRGVQIYFDTEIVGVANANGKLNEVVDQYGKIWKADIFISNSDAASFRGSVLKEKNSISRI